MIKVKVFFKNNDSFCTRINLTFEEAKKYYEGNIFNIGSVKDNLQKCIKIELLNV